MTNTAELHEEVRSHNSFVQLVNELDEERSSYEFIMAVEGVGCVIVENMLGSEPAHFGHLELGWLWLWWEAYHSDDRPAKLEKGVT